MKAGARRSLALMAAVAVALGAIWFVAHRASTTRDDRPTHVGGAAPAVAQPELRGAAPDRQDEEAEPSDRVARLVAEVRGPDGEAVEARVHVWRGTSHRVVAAPGGRAPLVIPCEDLCLVELQAEGLERGLWSEAKRFRIVAATEDTIRLDLIGHRVHGRVIEQGAGTPIEGASLWLGGGTKRERRGAPRVKSDKEGAFELLLAPSYDGRRLLAVFHDGYLPTEVEIPAVLDGLEIRMERRAHVRGVITLEDGRPAAGAQIRLQVMSVSGEPTRERPRDVAEKARQAWIEAGRRGDPDATEVRADSQAVADKDGAFDAPLAFPGTVYAVISYPGYRAETLKLEPGTYADEIEVVLRESRMKDGRLRVLRSDRTPLRGVLVWVQDDVIGLKQQTLLRAKTDKDGWISTAALVEGVKTRITITPDPDDPDSDASPSPIPFPWVVRHTDEVVVRKP